MPIVVQQTPSGSLIVSFVDVVPSARYDGSPWTGVTIQEAATQAGPFTQIDQLPLNPVDTDPTNPLARYLTTAKATLSEGFYVLTYFDAAGRTSQPEAQSQVAASQVRPTVAMLGAFMRGRTTASGSGGNELGTFTSQTRPTDAEAAQLIDQAATEVLTQTGDDIPDRLISHTRFAVMLYAAQLVELTFYRNEVNRDQSAFAQYQQLYKDGIQALKSAITDSDPASPAPSFVSVPIMSASQAHFQNIFKAFDPTTGKFDPTKLPPDEYYPGGVGGIPANLAAIWPWLGYSQGPFDTGLAWLEEG